MSNYIDNDVEAVISQVDGLLRAITITEMKLEYAGDGCQCKIHERVEHSIVGAEGCAGKKPGTMHAIRALYDNGSRFCHAEPGQIKLDVALARISSNMMVNSSAYAGGRYKPNKRYITGTATTLAYLGAGYCYLALFLPEVRVRVARVLGPNPLIVDVLRLARVVGSAEAMPYKVVMLSGNKVHIEYDTSVNGNGLSLVSSLAAVIQHVDAEARVGYDDMNVDYVDIDCGPSTEDGYDPRVGESVVLPTTVPDSKGKAVVVDESIDSFVVPSVRSTFGGDFVSTGGGDDAVGAILELMERKGVSVQSLKRAYVSRVENPGLHIREFDDFYDSSGMLIPTALIDDIPYDLRDHMSIVHEFLDELGVILSDVDLLDFWLWTMPADSQSLHVSSGRDLFKCWVVYGDQVLRGFLIKYFVSRGEIADTITKSTKLVSPDSLASRFDKCGFGKVMCDDTGNYSIKAKATYFRAFAALLALHFPGMSCENVLVKLFGL